MGGGGYPVPPRGRSPVTWDGGEDVLTHVALRSPSRAARLRPLNSSTQPQMSRLGPKAAFFGRAHYRTPSSAAGAALALQRSTGVLRSPWQAAVTTGKGRVPPAFPPSAIRGLFFSLPGMAAPLLISTETSPGRRSSFQGQIPPEPGHGSEKTPLRRGVTPWMLRSEYAGTI